MHEAAFARAALPAPCQVLGMTLKAFSIGHELRLGKSEGRNPKTETRNPKEAERLALIGAVLICCESWAEAQRGDWLAGLKMWIWGKRLRGIDWQIEAWKFAAYREEGALEFPLSSIPRPSSGPLPRPPGSPFLLRLQQFLVVRLGLSQVEAWDYPLGLAKMQWASYWEEEGGLQIYNWQDCEHDAFVAKCEEEDAEEESRKQKAEPRTLNLEPRTLNEQGKGGVLA